MRALFASLATLILCASSALAVDPYVTVTLPKNVSVKLPRNWRKLSENQITTLQATTAAKLRKLAPPADSGLAYAANYIDDAGKVAAKFNLRYYPDLDLSQADAASASPEEISELDATIKAGLVALPPGMLMEWKGTRRQQIGKLIAFVTEYTRGGSGKVGPTNVQLVRVFSGPNSFVATVTYVLAEEELLRPICEYVIESLTQG